jgi:hypothetical protein
MSFYKCLALATLVFIMFGAGNIEAQSVPTTFNVTGYGQWLPGEDGYSLGVEEAMNNATNLAHQKCAPQQALIQSSWSDVVVVGFGGINISADFSCDTISSDSVILSKETTTYLLSKLQSVGTAQKISIRAYVNEAFSPQFLYNLYYPGGSAGHSVDQNELRILFNELDKNGSPSAFVDGGSPYFEISTHIICLQDVCSHIAN